MAHDVTYIGELPAWYDSRAILMPAGFSFVIVHPDHPPHFWSSYARKWMPLKPTNPQEPTQCPTQ